MAGSKHEKHPLAYALVYGFVTVALSCSGLVGYLTYIIAFRSKILGLLSFGAVLSRFFKIAGGIEGIDRAVGNGKLSVLASVQAKGEKDPSHVRLVIISDTHNELPPVLPPGDILIHGGDFTLKGSSKEVHTFCDWLESQPFKYKIVIAGNHDMGLEFTSTDESKAAKDRLKSICTYLENEGTEVLGLRFWGSPQTPYISKTSRMGFQDSSENLAKYWDMIPEGIDVLITHGPPRGFGDRILLGKHVGCPELMKRVLEKKPRYHIFGHIHEAYGTYKGPDDRIYVNAATCNLLYNPLHGPILLDVPNAK